MKKIIKSRIFLVIITAIICITGTAYAINASSIDYNDTTVAGALDDLYTNLDTKIMLNTFDTALYDASYGVISASRTASLTLDTGKYIVYVSGTISGGGNGNSYTDTTLNITSDKECNKAFLSGKYVRAAGTASPNYGVYTAYSIYLVEILNDDTTLIFNYEATGHTAHAQTALISAIPINE